MKQRLFVLLLSFAPLHPAIATLPSESDAREILEKVAAVYTAHSVLELKGITTMEMHSDLNDSVMRMPFTLIEKNGDQYRFDGTTAIGAQQEIWDGKKLWKTQPLMNEYRVTEMYESPFATNFMLNLKAPAENLKAAKILREETLAGGHVCYVVELKYGEHNAASVDSATTTVWVDRESFYVWKINVLAVFNVGKLGGKSESAKSTVFSSIEKDVDLSAEAFVFKAPAGVTAQKAGMVFNQPGKFLLGRPAPDFTLPDLDGKSVHLADLKGKLVLLDFWATWCGPCRNEMPKLARLAEQFKSKDVVVLGVDVREDPDVVREFIKKNDTKYPILLTSGSPGVIDQYSANAYPSTVLIDKNGIIAEYKVGSGEHSESELAAAFTRVARLDYKPPVATPIPVSETVTARTTMEVIWPDPVTATDFVQRAQKELNSRQYDAAAQDARKALELKADSMPARKLLAQALYDAKQYDGAIEQYSKLIEQYPDWPNLYDLRGLAYSYSKNFSAAIPDYSKAIALDRYVAGPYNNRGWSYLELGDLAQALADLNRAIELSPSYARAYENRAKVFAKQNDRAQELADLETVLRITPASQWAKTERDQLLNGGQLQNKLAAPVLVAPADKTVFDIFPRRTTLEWQESPGAVSYVMQWDYSSQGVWTGELKNMFGEKRTESTSVTFDFVGAQPGRWRVCSVGADGQRGAWSEWRTFFYKK